MWSPIFLHNILLWFPNVAHLRLSTSCFIASSTQKLESLTIDVPPKFMAGNDITSPSPWNLIAALNRGLLSQGDPNVKKIITVNTDGNKPAGWEPAERLCALRGIRMLQNILYDVPTLSTLNGTYDQLLNVRSQSFFNTHSPSLLPSMIC